MVFDGEDLKKSFRSIKVAGKAGKLDDNVKFRDGMDVFLFPLKLSPRIPTEHKNQVASGIPLEEIPKIHNQKSS